MPDVRVSLSEVLEEGSVVMELARAFQDRGHELYVVGGIVRDALLGGAGDVDLTTDAPPEVTKAIVEPRAEAVWLQGIRFGTVGCRIGDWNMEITTFRSERYEPDSRHPEVNFEASIESDLARRDFTVNAMAIRLPDRAAVDLFDGRGDLERRILRTPIDPHESFTDDPLRMLRAFRFASQLEFQIAPEVLETITELREKLLTVSAERIRDELSRLLVGAAPAAALGLADSTGITDLFLPELGALKLEQDPVQKHKDVFKHTLAVLQRTEPHLEVRLAALLHDIAKPKTRKIGPEGVSFHHHEVEGAKMARARLRALRYPNDVVDKVGDLIFLHHRFHTYSLGWTDSAVRRYVRDAGPLLGELNALVRADCTTRNPNRARRLAARMDELEARIAELAEREEFERFRQPDLDGTQIMAYLGVPPSRVIGEAREFLIERRLDEGPLSEDAAYAALDAWARERGIEPVGERSPPKPRKEKEAE